MPSMRRVKLITLLIFLFVLTLLFYTASLRQSRERDSRTMGDFYDKTVNALNSKNSKNKNDVGTEDELIAKKMAESLKEAAQVAKDNANAKAPKPDPPSSVVGVGSAADGARGDERSVAGRKKFSSGAEEQKPVQEETPEDHEIEVELNSILKKSPSKFIIFPREVFGDLGLMGLEQLLSFRNRTVRIRSEQRAFCSRSTSSILHRMLWNLTSIQLAWAYKHTLRI
jgi:hypothetical protein